MYHHELKYEAIKNTKCPCDFSFLRIHDRYEDFNNVYIVYSNPRELKVSPLSHVLNKYETVKIKGECILKVSNNKKFY